jgi:hypothetical protein
MAITATTLSVAVASGPSGTDNFVNVASATGITAPNFTTGAGITWLLIDQEFMVVTAVNGTVISVLRGQGGTLAAPHVINTQVQIGLPGDFAEFGEFLKASMTSNQTEAAVNWPAIFLAGTADAIPASVPGFYVVKTGSADAMTLAAPPVSAEGNIVQVWSDTAFAHTITATSLIAAGVALKTTVTFPAFRGAGVMLRACNGVWHLLSGGGSATNGGPVVLT